MKLIQPPHPLPPENAEFANGHFYKAKYGNKFYYLCVAGFLADVVTGNALENIESGGIRPELFDDVTDDFAIVHNDILERNK